MPLLRFPPPLAPNAPSPAPSPRPSITRKANPYIYANQSPPPPPPPPQKGFTVSTHKLICPTCPCFPSPILIKNQASTSLKTPPSPHQLFEVQDSLDELMHFLPKLSVLFPLKNGFYSYRAQTAQHHPVDPDTYTVVARGVAGLYP